MPALVKSVVHELKTPAQASSDATSNPVSAPAPEPSRTEKRGKQRLSAVSQPLKKQNTSSSPVPAMNLPSFSPAVAPNSVASAPDPLFKASGSAVSAVNSPAPDPVEKPAPPPATVAPERDDPEALATVMENVSSSTPPVSSDLQQKDSAALLVPGRLIDNPRPVYPQEARRLGLQGTVLLSAVIGKDGSVMAVQTVSGPPILAGAAEDAVRKWKYTPSTINGQPVQVATQIKLNFNIESKQ
jgi:TonB family protein